MSTVDLKKKVTFDKSIIISEKESLAQQLTDNTGAQGQIRFNKDTLLFEGYHSQPNSDAGADIFGNKWRPFTQNVASTDSLGVIKVGSNLNMNAFTGILSSTANGVGRFFQNVITVSPIEGAAEYKSINEAITSAIGTEYEGYSNGILTSNIGSAPSPTYPFVIQVAPGQYSEVLNQIRLPDYVSIKGECNYNTVITQKIGSDNLEFSSMIYAGHNSEIKDIVIKLADSNTSINSIGIYSEDKSNIVIDNCIINTSSNSSTIGNTYGIYIKNGLNNKILNSTLDINSSMLAGNVNAIYLNNTTPQLLNNSINILTSNSTVNNGIYMTDCIGSTSSIKDKLYIENLNLSNNYFTSNTGSTSTGIDINNSSFILKNSEIEVSNNLDNTNNYGIKISSAGNIAPYLSKTTSNVISFVNTTTGVNAGLNTIESSDIAAFNFITENYDRGHYISVAGSTANDGIYKISNTLKSNVITLETGFNLVNESVSPANNITLKALYDINIYNSTIKASSNTIKNADTNSNYNVNLYNVINEGSVNNIEPSHTFYNDYKTISVGKVNCNFNSLYNAMNSISDNSSINRYLIKIQSGVYHETNVITCKEYVDIEGNGEDNTLLQFYRYDNTSGITNSNTTCFLVSSNSTIKNIKIQNSNGLTTYIAGQTTSSIINNTINPINNLVIENITIDGTSHSAYIYAINLYNGTNIILKNVEIIAKSSSTAIENIGIQSNACSNCMFNNINATLNSSNTVTNTALKFIDSEGIIYNPKITVNSGTHTNTCIKTININNTQKFIQVFNGEIRAYDNVDYSIYGDNYYTMMCSGLQILGDIFENTTFSRLYFNSCYSFTNENDKYYVSLLNNLGENNQLNGTISIDETAGKRNADGINNIFIGINSGSNITTASFNTLVGFHTGLTMTGGDNNVLLGSYVGQNITNAVKNTIIGSNAATSITMGNENVISGYQAGNSMTTANNNIIMGTNTATSLTTGNLNVFIGDNTATNTLSSNQNTFIGGLSGRSNQTGNDNTYLGYQTGNNAVTAHNNVLIGKHSGYTNLSSNIVAVGTTAGYNNTSSLKNTYIGHQSGYNNTTGDCNTYVGNNAGKGGSTSSNSFNTVIGNEAGYSLTSGARNVLIGSTTNNSNANDAPGWALDSGSDNIYIGSNNGALSTSSINNVLIGSQIGTSITTSNNNVFIGKNTGNALTSNDSSIIIGSESGNNNTNANTLIIGQSSGDGYTGDIAFSIGHNTGKNVTGDYNMFIGQNAGSSGSTKSGTNNLSIGPYSGNNLTTGSRNISVGSGNNTSSTGRFINTGSDNTLLGYHAGKVVQSGIGNTLLGSNSGAHITSGNYNVNIGTNSGFKTTLGSHNISLGNESNYSLEEGNFNISSGYRAGYSITNGDNNINIGQKAGLASTTASTNIHIGLESGLNSTASDNLFLGNKTGAFNTNGTKNIFIGNKSGHQNKVTDNNIYLGNQCGKHNRGDGNIFIGYELSDDPVNEIESNITNLTNTFSIYRNTNSGIETNSTTSCKILIGGDLSSGAVGIGTNTPSQYIDPPLIPAGNDDYILIVVGNILANRVHATNFSPFTGSHIVNIDNSITIDNLLYGMIMGSTGTVDYKDINNSIITVKPSSINNDKTVYGIYSSNEIVTNESNVSTTVYYVNSVGEGGIIVTNYNGEIQNGDYITTCPIIGYGSLQTDDILHSYTVAKCTQTVDWSSISTTIEYNATTYKYCYVSCTYHCG